MHSGTLGDECLSEPRSHHRGAYDLLTLTAAVRGWTSAPTADAAAAFGVYRAALDREERAAEVYGRLVMQLAGGTSLTFNS